jgi:NarL family two-component system response regulator LiaR
MKEQCMAETEPLRILLVDDHALVRSGLKNFIFAYDWMTVVGEAADGAEAVAFCADHPVDVVLMDIVMPGMDGVEATRQILALGKPVKVIVLTSYYEQEMVEQAFKAGAISYLLKNVSAAELAQAIRAAFAGRATLAPEATEALINAARQKPGLGPDLTERELQVLTLLVRGQSNSEIATQFNISLATVKYHLSNIFNKLGAKSRVEAVTIALKHNLVEKE